MPSSGAGDLKQASAPRADTERRQRGVVVIVFGLLTDTGVVHHVEVASIESWVGSDQERFTKLEGDTLIIKAPPLPAPPDGKRGVGTLVWQRSE